MSLKDTEMVLSTSDVAATYRTNLSGWVSRTGQYWGTDEHMARWTGATHVPCSECRQPVEKSWTKCDACREKADVEKWRARERRPYDGGYVYSEAVGRFFADEDELRDYLDVEETGAVDSLRLVLCEPVYPRELDGDDLFLDDLPENCTLDDVAPDLAEQIVKVNECIAAMRKEKKAISWQPSRYAVDLSTLPSDLRPTREGWES